MSGRVKDADLLLHRIPGAAPGCACAALASEGAACRSAARGNLAGVDELDKGWFDAQGDGIVYFPCGRVVRNIGGPGIWF